MDKNIIYFCEFFYGSSYIPISLYNREGTSVYKSPSIQGNPAANFPEALWRKITEHKRNPDYFISDKTYASYGIIWVDHTGEYVIIGPVFNTFIASDIVTEFMKENHLSKDLKEEVTVFLQNIPIENHFQFINQLIFLNFCLNKTQVKPEDYLYFDNSVFKDIAFIHTEQTIERKETTNFHNTYLLEQKMFDYIKRGEKEKLKDFLVSAAKNQLIKEGTLASTPLRQAKNIFLASITKIGTLGAIKGGMDVEEAYQLMDLYSQKCEQLTDISSIKSLHLAALEDFCDRVYQTRLPEEYSVEIFVCMNFISNSTNHPIQVTDVANFAGRSISYLSKKFKDEVGISIGKQIMKSKLEDAKHLLLYSEKSLSEISNYLCFSSQSYFQNVFKKEYGMTPAKFRNSTL